MDGMRHVIIRGLFGSLLLFGIAASVHAWEYDSGWRDFLCISSKNMPWTPRCAVSEGPKGHSQAQWFTAGLPVSNLPFGEGSCSVTLRALYGGWLSWEPNEDFIFTKDGRSVTIMDRENRTSPARLVEVTLPGRFTFRKSGNNEFTLQGRGGSPWSRSVWFGDYNVYFWGADVQEAPGKRAIRIRCNNSNPPLTISVSATPSSGEAPMTTVVRAQASGGNSRTKEYRFRCSNGASFSSWSTSSVSTCSYSTGGTYTITANVRQGSTVRSATTRVTVTQPRTATCPFTSGTIVFFSKRLERNVYLRIYEDVSYSLPRGNYEVKLAAYDSYAHRVYVTQPQEQFVVELRDGNGRIARSNPSQDLADYQAFAQWSGTVNSNLSVSRDATIVRARHILDYNPRSGSNSLQPLCARFTRVQPPAVCGNGIVESGEECDDGNDNNTDACTRYCKNAYCGDGYIRSGREECDGGPGCTSSCTLRTVTGVCGTAADEASCLLPMTNLCSSGAASTVHYDASTRRWRWQCASTTCSAPKRCTFSEATP